METAVMPHIRWMIRRDMLAVMLIEEMSHEKPWSEFDFLDCLRQRKCIAIVAEQDDKVVGYLLYELRRGEIRILNMAVHPDYRRSGVGSALVEKVKAKGSAHMRGRITAVVSETNLAGHLFFKHASFRGIRVLWNYFEQPDEDGYLMRHESKGATC